VEADNAGLIIWVGIDNDKLTATPAALKRKGEQRTRSLCVLRTTPHPGALFYESSGHWNGYWHNNGYVYVF
jgi:hypothetical protein